MRTGSSLTPSIASLVVLCGVVYAAPLPGHEFADLKKEAQKSAARGDVDDLAAKLRDCARDDSKRAAEFISDLAVRVPDMKVYNAGRDAIAGMRSPEATEGLNDLVKNERNPMIKILLIDALGERDDDASGPGLASALSDHTDEVLRAAVAAAKKRKCAACVDGLIDIVAKLEEKDEGSLLLRQVREALLAITDQQITKAVDWRTYWAAAKSNFRVATGGPPRELQGGSTNRPHPQFFGTEIRSNRLVFVIDTSGSMEAADPLPAGGGGEPTGGPAAGGSRVRMERAKQQLKQVINALGDDVQFTCLSFSGAMFGGPGGGASLPPGVPEDGPLPPVIGGFEWLKTFKPHMVRANARSKTEACAWVDALQANGSTFTFNALTAAFQVEGADTIVLLSDGAPNDFDRKAKTEMSADQIIDGVTLMNRFKHLRIDTFGFDPAGGDGGGPPAGGGGGGGGTQGRHHRGGGGGGGGGMGGLSEFMEKLAEANGGGYTQIQ